MYKPLIVLSIFAALFVCESSGDYISPTYKPPPTRPPIYRFRRSDDQPLWLYKGDDVPRAPSTADHPFLPKYIDDIRLDPNRRVARSLSTPRATKGGGNVKSSNQDTGPTHPGYNRRRVRDATAYPTLPPRQTAPQQPQPRPQQPQPPPRYPGDNPGRVPIYRM